MGLKKNIQIIFIMKPELMYCTGLLLECFLKIIYSTVTDFAKFLG
jgi:hypothetical protein